MSKHAAVLDLKAHLSSTRISSYWSDFKLLISMTKPKIVISIALTALIGFVLHPSFLSFPVWTSLILVISVVLGTAGGAVLNHYLERETDKLMERTKERPLPSGKLTLPAQSALWFGIILTMLGVSLCYAFLGVASAVCLFLGAFAYVVIYTMWLKPRSVWNVPIGGIAGSFAVLVGSNVGALNVTSESIFFALVLFFWSPAHFWNFAIYRRDDYAKAGIPFLPETVGINRTNCWIAVHTIAVILSSMGLAIWGNPGWLYGTIALASGSVFLFFNICNILHPSDALSKKNFIYSLIYLTTLFFGVIVDFYYQLFWG